MKNKIFILSLCLSTALVQADSKLEHETGMISDSLVVSSKGSQSVPSDEYSQLAKGVIVGTISYYPIVGGNFLGRESGFTYNTPGGRGDIYCADGSTERFVDHEIKMATDDVLEGFRIWGSDSNVTQDMRAIFYRSCLPGFAAGPLNSSVFFNELMVASTGEFSQFHEINKSFEVMEEQCKVMARISFGSSGTCNGAENVVLYKVRAQLRSGEVIFQDNFNIY